MASTEERKATKEIREVRTYRSTKTEEQQIAARAKTVGLPRCTWVREAAKQAIRILPKEERELLLRIDWQLHAIGVNLNQLVHLAHVGKVRSSRSFRETLRDLNTQLNDQRDTIRSACRTEEA